MQAHRKQVLRRCNLCILLHGHWLILLLFVVLLRNHISFAFALPMFVFGLALACSLSCCSFCPELLYLVLPYCVLGSPR